MSNIAYFVFTRIGVIYASSQLEAQERRNVAVTVSTFPTIVSFPTALASHEPDSDRPRHEDFSHGRLKLTANGKPSLAGQDALRLAFESAFPLSAIQISAN